MGAGASTADTGSPRGGGRPGASRGAPSSGVLAVDPRGEELLGEIRRPRRWGGRRRPRPRERPRASRPPRAPQPAARSDPRRGPSTRRGRRRGGRPGARRARRAGWTRRPPPPRADALPRSTAAPSAGSGMPTRAWSQAVGTGSPPALAARMSGSEGSGVSGRARRGHPAGRGAWFKAPYQAMRVSESVAASWRMSSRTKSSRTARCTSAWLRLAPSSAVMVAPTTALLICWSHQAACAGKSADDPPLPPPVPGDWTSIAIESGMTHPASVASAATAAVRVSMSVSVAV